MYCTGKADAKFMTICIIKFLYEQQIGLGFEKRVNMQTMEEKFIPCTIQDTIYIQYHVQYNLPSFCNTDIDENDYIV